MLLCRCFCKREEVIGPNVVDSLPYLVALSTAMCRRGYSGGTHTNRTQRITRKTQSCFVHVKNCAAQKDALVELLSHVP